MRQEIGRTHKALIASLAASFFAAEAKAADPVASANTQAVTPVDAERTPEIAGLTKDAVIKAVRNLSETNTLAAMTEISEISARCKGDKTQARILRQLIWAKPGEQLPTVFTQSLLKVVEAGVAPKADTAAKVKAGLVFELINSASLTDEYVVQFKLNAPTVQKALAELKTNPNTAAIISKALEATTFFCKGNNLIAQSDTK